MAAISSSPDFFHLGPDYLIFALLFCWLLLGWFFLMKLLGWFGADKFKVDILWGHRFYWFTPLRCGDRQPAVSQVAILVTKHLKIINGPDCYLAKYLLLKDQLILRPFENQRTNKILHMTIFFSKALRTWSRLCTYSYLNAWCVSWTNQKRIHSNDFYN